MFRRNVAAALILLAIPALADHAAAKDGAAQVQAPPAPGYPAVPLLSTGTTIIGEPLRYPTSGAAHVTAAIVTLAPGESTIVHRHGVPLFAYILEGELTVDYGSHGKRTYHKGQAFMEAMATAHSGTNTGTQPARLVAVYMGAEGARDVIADK
jgi:quercetin dioxygenase-like cupin family protein